MLFRSMVDFMKSGAASRFLQEIPVQKVPVPRSLAAVTTNDSTLKCEECGWKVLQKIGSANGEVRCANCGHQQGGSKTKPMPGRRGV